jgi:hypothetical protein
MIILSQVRVVVNCEIDLEITMKLHALLEVDAQNPDLRNLVEDKLTELLGMKLDTLYYGLREVTENTQNEKWTGNFDAAHLNLGSLKYAPKSVNGQFDCSGNLLTSLEYAPKNVDMLFDCSNNQITTLLGAPEKVGWSFVCNYNRGLKSLEHFPAFVGENVELERCGLTSLQNVHKHIKKMNGMLNVIDNEIKSHVLGVLLINGCKEVFMRNADVEDILNSYLHKGNTGRQAVVACQKELIDAGYVEYAKL